MWYGLYKNDELIAVNFFNSLPNIFDFKYPFSTLDEYTICEVEIYKKGN